MQFARLSAAALVLLASCAAPIHLDATYTVRDSVSAIAIAKMQPRCLHGGVDHWDATLKGDEWQVKAYYFKGERSCNWETMTINAKSGKASSVCEVCVTAD